VRTLVVNGDDFGLSPGVNDGILEAHTRGVLTSASLMVLESAAESAAELARHHPELSVGLHFVDDGPELDDPGHAAKAFAVQLARFRELTGRDPTHVDSHHHVHTVGERLHTFARLVAPLGVPLRLAGPVRYVGAFYGQTRRGVTSVELLSRSYLVHLAATETFDGFTELGCHPAKLSGDFRSSYLREREVELATLTEPGLREELEELGVRLASFHDWALSDASRASSPGASV
jgi:chitin disaccharide deacetylase